MEQLWIVLPDPRATLQPKSLLILLPRSLSFNVRECVVTWADLTVIYFEQQHLSSTEISPDLMVCVFAKQIYLPEPKKRWPIANVWGVLFGNSSFWNHTLFAHEWNQFRGWCFVVGWSELVIWWCMRTFELTWPHVDFEFRCLLFFAWCAKHERKRLIRLWPRS